MPLIPPPTTSTSPILSFLELLDVSRSTGMLDDFLDNFSDVLDLYRSTILQAQAAIRKICDAIWTGSNQHLSPDINGLFQSKIGESFPLGSFHPDPASTSSATETVFPI